MNNRIISALLCIALSCFLLNSCKKAELVFTTDEKSSLLLYPASKGECVVEEKLYNIPYFPDYNTGIVYYPKQNIATPGPLVLILHGNGTGGQGNYSEIGKHLASQGFRVASISWPSGNYKAADKIDYIKSIIYGHIRFLYANEQSPLKSQITDDIVLMGHSRGGAAAITYAAEIEKIKNVQSVIALAPSPADLDMKERYDLSTVKSFLVLYGSADPDVTGAYEKENDCRGTGFMFFDNAGSEWGNSSLTKDMVFIKDLNHITFNDIAIDIYSGSKIDVPRQTLIKGYINAFLQLHINKKESYNQFFKFQKHIPLTDPTIKVSQQHADTEKLVVVNFENNKADKITHYGGTISYPVSTLQINVDKALVTDHASFHSSKVMTVGWMQHNEKPAPVINFPFNSKIDLSDYKYLSLRTGLCVNKINNLKAGQSFYIQLHDANGNGSTLIPITIPPTFFQLSVKTYMQSFLLSLNDFKGIDLKRIQSVSLSFTNKNFPQGIVMLDNIEFYK